MKVTVKMWDPWSRDEADAQQVEFENPSNPPLDSGNIFLRWEVQSFMEKKWADNDYVTPMSVNVRTPDGALVEFEVHAEQTVNFRAIPKPTP